MLLDIIAVTLAIELLLACFGAAQPNHRWVPQRKVRFERRFSLACPIATKEHFERQTIRR